MPPFCTPELVRKLSSDFVTGFLRIVQPTTTDRISQDVLEIIWASLDPPAVTQFGLVLRYLSSYSAYSSWSTRHVALSIVLPDTPDTLSVERLNITILDGVMAFVKFQQDHDRP